MEIYVVKAGDTLQSIATQYGVSAERVAFDNNIEGENLVVGQALLIAIPETIYTIQNGDTLQSIADAFDTTVLQLVRNNSYLLNESFLLPGRQLVIAYQDANVDAGANEANITNMDNGRRPEIFGYAYGFIRDDILEESCLYIDELLPFSYGFNIDGTLIPMNDDHLLNEANRFGLQKRMVITPLDINERFNNQLVVMVLTDTGMREAFINNILQTMTEKGYQALDIDFEFIPGDFRDAYVAFVAEVRGRLVPQGYQVSVAVPPKTSADQPGLLYEGIDYAGIGAVADTVFLMTYEWGYKFGPPMAVAPVPSVRRVLDYAVSVIPREKLDMGIPNYAYDWPLPYESGVTEAETIGNMEAIRRAFRYGAFIQYDEQAKAPYFTYTLDGVDHIVWFEDVRSIAAKYDLIMEYGLRGAGYWNLMREFRQNWMYLNLLA